MAYKKIIFAGILLGISPIILKLCLNNPLFSLSFWLYFIPFAIINIAAFLIFQKELFSEKLSASITLLTGTITLTSVILGIIILSETLNIYKLIGIVLILIGIIII
ncbi:MAG: EamA family transporter [Candidatus Parvarchaeota archaeon]|nr:EamA family transporter [Candidatus Jingweiarchaeum tengchongense]MCW1300098.1 EamA family transporter [Candidatus Jingweiarchaeum tengchongense]MCW1304452.1 EamA family transporter [Candidatus Jingweiarchaeum tengchongense]MCW1305619.1 EamA family transporter [Candidatus Jingweiarchaeum tengchongense]MCW1309260.1 EamA family transporter [Candidatus Jingweiarchaeum tengchongense]